MIDRTPEPQFLRVVRSLRGLRVLEMKHNSDMMKEGQLPQLWALTERMGHVQTIVLTMRFNDADQEDLHREHCLMAIKLTERNRRWVRPCQTPSVLDDN